MAKKTTKASKMKSAKKPTGRSPGRPVGKGVPREGRRIFRFKVSRDEWVAFVALAKKENRPRETLLRMILIAGAKWLKDGKTLRRVTPAMLTTNDNRVELKTRLDEKDYKAVVKGIDAAVHRENTLRRIVATGVAQVSSGKGLG